MPMHPDFQKIWKQFMRRYCGGHTVCDKGKQVYYAWLNKLGLDDEQPYGRQAFRERFSWMQPHFDLIKQDNQAKYYKVEALFPLVSMNQNIYTEDELLRGTRTLRGKRVNINHTVVEPADVSIERAEYEDDCAEVLLRVGRTARYRRRPIVEMIDSGEICHVSIEADCLGGAPAQDVDGEVGYACVGLEFTGLALLTKYVLPGVPLTRILPVERIVAEAVTLSKGERNMTEKQKPDRATARKPKTEDCDHAEQIADLKQQLTTLQRGNRDLQETVDALEGQLQAKDRQLKAKATRLSHLDEKEDAVAKLELEVSDLKRTNRAKAEELRALHAAVDVKDRELAAKKQSATETEDAIATLRLEVSDLKRTAREREEQLKTLHAGLAGKEEELAAKDDRIARVEHELTQAQKQVDDAAARLSELRDLHKDTVDKTSDLAAEKVKLEKRIELIEAEKEQLAAAAETLRSKFEDTSNKRFDLAQRNIQLTQTLTARNDEIVALKEENDQLRAQLRKAKRMGRKIGKVKVAV
jgi:hypothetical protein